MGSIPSPSKSGSTSKESTEAQLKLAREQGRAYGEAVAEMATSEADEGSLVEAGDLIVGYAIEDAEGMYVWEDGQLLWHDPTGENAHIEVVVRDAYDGRFVPGLDVSVTLAAEDGTEVGTHEQPFLWHPWLHHYGRNWTLPGDGTYRLGVHIKPAAFMRHDKENGHRFARPVDVEWPSVHIQTGQKKG